MKTLLHSEKDCFGLDLFCSLFAHVLSRNVNFPMGLIKRSSYPSTVLGIKGIVWGKKDKKSALWKVWLVLVFKLDFSFVIFLVCIWKKKVWGVLLCFLSLSVSSSQCWQFYFSFKCSRSARQHSKFWFAQGERTWYVKVVLLLKVTVPPLVTIQGPGS